MKKIFLIFVFLFFSIRLQASCLIGDAQMKSGRIDRAKISYETCAFQNNDAEGQYALGLLYRDGKEPVKQNIKMALFYFRLAAENGYAPAQRDLAELMDTLEELGAVGKEALKDYDAQMQDKSFGMSLSAFGWALLAAEKEDNKWFYPSPVMSDEKAVRLVKKWTSLKGNSAKKQAIKEATAWKEERLVKTAYNLLSSEEYADFLSKINSKGTDAQTVSVKKKALADLKQVWENKKN